jgi:hypothetical protein
VAGVGKQESRRLTADLAELLLDDWRQSWLTQQAEGTAPPQLLPQLSELELTTEQACRAAIFARLTGTPAGELPGGWIAALQSPRRRTLLSLTDRWAVLPELLIPDPSQSSSLVTGGSSEGQSLLQRAEAAIVFPERFVNADEKVQLADQLIERGHVAAAELLLAAWWESLGDDRGEERRRLELLLERVRMSERGGDVWQRLSIEPAGQRPSEGSVASTDFGATPELIPEFRFASVTSEMRNAVDVLPSTAEPWWLSHKLVVSRQRGERPGPLLEVVARDGSGVLSRLPETEYADDLAAPFSQTNRGVSVPGLIPLRDQNQLMMLSVNNTGQCQLLWSRPFSAAQSLLSPRILLMGSLGPGYFVWFLDGTLHCTHPLTGVDLWTQRLNVSGAALFRAGLIESPIFGDELVTAVYNSESGVLQTFETRTGKPGRSLVVQPGLGTQCGTVGRFLIYTDLDYHLKILDTASCELVPGDGQGVVIGQQHLDQLYAVLPGNVIVTVTREGELVFIDLAAGRVLARVRLPEGTEVTPLAVKAFEQGERVYVVVEDRALAGGIRALPTTPPRQTERGINDGLLVCLPREKNRVLWARRLENCQFPTITGAATDVLIACSAGFGRDRMEDGGLTDLLQVRILRGATGQTVAEAKGLPLSMPAWVHHDARRSEIRLQSSNGNLVVRPTAP